MAVMHIKGCVGLTVILFIVFTIGLNLGLHGVLVFDENSFVHLSPGLTEKHATDDAATAATVVDHGNIHEIDVKSSVAGINSKPPTIEDISVNSVPSSQKVTVSSKHEIDNELEISNAVIGLNDRIAKITALVFEHAAKDLKEISERKHIDSANNNNNPLGAFEFIPIVLLTCNRPQLLRSTLESLMQVRGLDKQDVMISQDGALQEVADIAKEFDLQLIQNTEGIRLRGGAAADGASRIAMHYKYSLTAAFERFANSQAVIVLEDDLLFSKDLYQYLLSVAPILNADPTAFVVSAWNDNGFKNKVKDPYALRRTDYFPGLGWLLTRQLYKNELEPNWPASHWDHWLRSPEVSKHRDIIYPQVQIRIFCLELLELDWKEI